MILVSRRTLSADLTSGCFWVMGGAGKSAFLEPRDPSNAEQNELLLSVGATFEFWSEQLRCVTDRARLQRCLVMTYGEPDQDVLREVSLESVFSFGFSNFWAERIKMPPLAPTTEIFLAMFGSAESARADE